MNVRSPINAFLNVILVGLVVGLIFYFNPFELYNQYQDDRLQQLASDYSSAAKQYYEKYNNYPWDNSPVGSDCVGRGIIPNGQQSLYVLSVGNINCTSYFTGEDFLKDTFPSNSSTILNQITLSFDPVNKVNYICYKPSSKKYQKQSSTKYSNPEGLLSPIGTCLSAHGTNECYWCAN